MKVNTKFLFEGKKLDFVNNKEENNNLKPSLHESIKSFKNFISIFFRIKFRLYKN